jgi:hypothetical protein
MSDILDLSSDGSEDMDEVTIADVGAEDIPEAGDNMDPGLKAPPKKEKAAPKKVEPGKKEADPGKKEADPEKKPETKKSGDEDLDGWRKKREDLRKAYASQQRERPAQQAPPQAPPPQQQAPPPQQQAPQGQFTLEQIQAAARANPLGFMAQLGIDQNAVQDQLLDNPYQAGQPQPNLQVAGVMQQFDARLGQMQQMFEEREQALKQQIQEMRTDHQRGSTQTYLASMAPRIPMANHYLDDSLEMFDNDVSRFEQETGVSATAEDRQFIALDIEDKLVRRELEHIEENLLKHPRFSAIINSEALMAALGRQVTPAAAPGKQEPTLGNEQELGGFKGKSVEEMDEEELEEYARAQAAKARA